MRLYETDEPRWYGTQADAKASGRPFVQREVPIDKPGLLAWLNNNSVSADPVIADIRREPEPVYNPGAQIPVQPDDGFEQLPVAQQLHLACLALENARDLIGKAGAS